jgi:hypothetical protein
MTTDDEESNLPLDPNMSPTYQWVIADARRRLAAGTLPKDWCDRHLPAIDSAIVQIRNKCYVQ